MTFMQAAWQTILNVPDRSLPAPRLGRLLKVGSDLIDPRLVLTKGEVGTYIALGHN